MLISTHYLFLLIWVQDGPGPVVQSLWMRKILKRPMPMRFTDSYTGLLSVLSHQKCSKESIILIRTGRCYYYYYYYYYY